MQEFTHIAYAHNYIQVHVYVHGRTARARGMFFMIQRPLPILNRRQHAQSQEQGHYICRSGTICSSHGRYQAFREYIFHRF